MSIILNQYFNTVRKESRGLCSKTEYIAFET